eukprot:COSAG01_NODE_5578_length_4171_cov_12.697200_6_plen_84_part_00
MILQAGLTEIPLHFHFIFMAAAALIWMGAQVGLLRHKGYFDRSPFSMETQLQVVASERQLGGGGAGVGVGVPGVSTLESVHCD